MERPFNYGDKVRCIKKGDWHLNAGRGEKTIDNNPQYGEMYTVGYVDRPVCEPGETNNGVEWCMTLLEFPEDGKHEDIINIYSCRRFELV